MDHDNRFKYAIMCT